AITDAIKKDRSERYSGRGDWSVKQEDKINSAIDEVIEEGGEKPRSVEDYLRDEGFLEQQSDDENVSESELIQNMEESDEQLSPQEEVTEEVAEAGPDETEEAQESKNPESKEEISATGKISLDTTDMAVKQVEDALNEDEASKVTKAAPEKPSTNKQSNKKAPDKKKHIGNRELEERVRTMTPEEKELFGPYIHHKKSRRQIINAIDNLSMDPFTGNAIVTGEEGAGTVNLAKGLMKAMQASDSNFSGKVAKITANVLNKKNTASIFDKLANGALIIQRAADLTQETVSELLKILQEENKGLVLVMEDTKEDMDRFLDKNPSLKQSFNVRVDIEALDDDSLVAYARQYALEKEYAIDNLGILALHTRISERQTLDHDVTVSEVKDIVDDAIYYAEKRSVAHFVDVLVHKRYDENDMIILREKDFMHD
ncbi:MAG: hypothetical protein J6L93_06025, partial [Butyrivibrio sp.]|nr:hypothetical protein [Butyrivibrio sp.]